MHLTVIAAVFPLVFLAELPDKTMFASLVMATRGRPLAVWAGASIAFAAHVAIAVSAGVVLFHLVPHRAVEVVVGVLFAVGAGYSYLARNADDPVEGENLRSARTVVLSSAGVIFLAEWGDLTQILTADLAAEYHSWPSVGVAALAALMAVAAVAVVSGSRLLARFPVRVMRLVTAVILALLAAYTLARAI
jgi:putative Ca2+/H+ antiporter (TMEM165/GDT1 family)